MKILLIILSIILPINYSFCQSVTLTPKGNTLTQFSLSNTSDITETGSPSISQLIYNTNALITGANANGIGYYYWNGVNWQSLDANIPSGTVVFSETHPNQALINSGFQFLTTTTTQVPAINQWLALDTLNQPKSTVSGFLESFENKVYKWHNGIFGFKQQEGGVFNTQNGLWSKMDTVNSPKDNYTDFKRLKDKEILQVGRILFFLNPNSNTWSKQSIPESINSQQMQASILRTSESSNFTFYWDGQSGFYFNAINQTFNSVSLINAPIGPVNLENLFWEINQNRVFWLDKESGQGYLFDLSQNEWSGLSSVNKPNIDAPSTFLSPTGKYHFLTLDTENIFFRKSISDGISPDSAKVARYSILESQWYYDIPELITNYSYQTVLQYIGKSSNESLVFELPNFSGSGYKKIELFILKNNSWLPTSFEDKRDPRWFYSKKYLCGDKVFFIGNFRYAPGWGIRPEFGDGVYYDLILNTWNYIPTPFNRINMGNLACVNTSLFSSNNALMHFDNNVSNQTSKLLFLYKKQ